MRRYHNETALFDKLILMIMSVMSMILMRMIVMIAIMMLIKEEEAISASSAENE